MASRGVIFYNKGTKCIVRLILCINSLRRHYQGPITVFIEGNQPEHLTDDLAKQFGVDFIYDENPKSATLVRKIEISQKSPYDATLFIDADMLVLGDISEFLDAAPRYDLVASHFTDWKSDGGTIVRRIKRFEPLKPDYIQKAINFGPAINTGIYAFPKNSPIWKEWWETATWGEEKGIYIPDEVAVQVIAPQYKVHVLPSKYNVSVVYGNHISDKRVIHFHGRKHCKEFPLCEIWIREFNEALRSNLCHIRDYIGKDMNEKRLAGFLKGKYGWPEYVREAKDILTRQPIPIAAATPTIAPPIPGAVTEATLSPRERRRLRREKRRLRQEKRAKNLAGKTGIVVPPLSSAERNTIVTGGQLDNRVTMVTAVDTKYVDFLRTSLPNWIKYKHIHHYPMIVYVNGFSSVDDPRLAFIRQLHPRARIIPWDLPGATSQREKMLSSFVFGTARDVQTEFWMKLDADAFATNVKSLLTDDMFDYVIAGHKWHYTRPGIWIKELDDWASGQKVFQGTSAIFNPKNLGEKRYIHERTASYVQLHSTEFTVFAAKLAGNRLPVPSQDTYLWYVAKRCGLPIMRHNFKRFRGMSNVPRLEKLRTKILEVEQSQNASAR